MITQKEGQYKRWQVVKAYEDLLDTREAEMKLAETAGDTAAYEKAKNSYNLAERRIRVLHNKYKNVQGASDLENRRNAMLGDACCNRVARGRASFQLDGDPVAEKLYSRANADYFNRDNIWAKTFDKMVLRTLTEEEYVKLLPRKLRRERRRKVA